MQQQVDELAATVRHPQQPAYYDQIIGEIELSPAAPFGVPASTVPAAAPSPAQQIAVILPPEPVAPSKPVEPAVGVFPRPDIQQKPGDTFKDCDVCPEMVVLPAGEFMMSSPKDEKYRIGLEWPQRKVTIAGAFALGKFEVTRDQFETFLKSTAYKVDEMTEECDSYRPRSEDYKLLRLNSVVCVSWGDARVYAEWLSKKSNKTYRLPSEAEWEYAARAGTTTAYYFGDSDNEISDKVAMLRANSFGAHDLIGSVSEWVEDCGNFPGFDIKLSDLHSDGSAWTNSNCNLRMRRGGSVRMHASHFRSAFRIALSKFSRSSSLGFRVARNLP